MLPKKNKATPEEVAAAARPSRVDAHFSAKVSRTFTGKIQFRVNGPAVATTNFGRVLRGEVKEVRNPDVANSLVENGHFAHVAAETEVGQPEEFRTPASEQTAEATTTAPVQPVEPTTTETTRTPAPTGTTTATPTGTTTPTEPTK